MLLGSGHGQNGNGLIQRTAGFKVGKVAGAAVGPVAGVGGDGTDHGLILAGARYALPIDREPRLEWHYSQKVDICHVNRKRKYTWND
jgi:hypothetical protein